MNATTETTLPPTTRLYTEDPYARTASAHVLEVHGQDVILDQTIAYAEAGGQAADVGQIQGIPFIDVQHGGGRPFVLPNGESATVDTVIRHVIDGDNDLRPGDEIDIEIDWDRRYANMRMHSLAHFLFHATGLWLTAHGMPRQTKGCFIEGSSARFDFVASIPADAVPEIEASVRSLVGAAGKAHTERLADGVYLWRSGDIEIPCGGTHVKDAAELAGQISVRRRSKGRDLTRLYVSLA